MFIQINRKETNTNEKIDTDITGLYLSFSEGIIL